MKALRPLLLLTLPTALLAQPPVPESGLLHVRKLPRSLMISLEDPQNRAWLLQTSNNLTTWQTVRKFRVANTNWTELLTPPAGTASLFTRVVQQRRTPPLTRNRALDATPYRYEIFEVVPDELRGRSRGTPTVDNHPALLERPVEGASLGRVLFYDKRLSANNTVSCSSCHQQKHAFADPRRVSPGFIGREGTRNAPSLVNTNFEFAGEFFWDRRAATLEDAVLLPIQHPDEMGLTLREMCDKIAAEAYYNELFEDRFGSAEVTAERVSLALSQFLRSIVSRTTRFDQVRGPSNSQDPDRPRFTTLEERGWWVFSRRCYFCHTAPAFQTQRTENIGLESPYRDPGAGGISQIESEEGLFKIPTLRNIALTAPYMHDGRFQTLEQVVEHYSENIVEHPNLHGKLHAGGMQIPEDDKAALIAFLHTLTDHALINDPRFSDPFHKGTFLKSASPHLPARPPITALPNDPKLEKISPDFEAR